MENLILDALTQSNTWAYSDQMVVLLWSHLASQLIMLSLHHILSPNTVLNAITNSVSLMCLHNDID